FLREGLNKSRNAYDPPFLLRKGGKAPLRAKPLAELGGVGDIENLLEKSTHYTNPPKKSYEFF
ncbi:MAG: hypothetical protein QM537_06750, partial [Candidatus Symbiobacter sp.]|nr:hypothetical protein [Candidatus Symbiobacter sp.]